MCCDTLFGVSCKATMHVLGAVSMWCLPAWVIKFIWPPNPMTVSLQVTSLYETVMDQDFRVALQSIKPDTVLWEVTGKRTSDVAEAALPIGQLVLTSGVVASSYCDDSLFFQHMRHRRPEP